MWIKSLLQSMREEAKSEILCRFYGREKVEWQSLRIYDVDNYTVLGVCVVIVWSGKRKRE